MNALATQILDLYKHHNLGIATAESCTGGMLAAALTAIPGSSSVFERGWVTYSNQAKHDELNVGLDDLVKFGAVSEVVAIAMAQGALDNSPADVAVSITGIAGPDGGSPEKPVGLVHFACTRRGHPPLHSQHIFSGNRDEIRLQATRTALNLLQERLL